MEPRLCSLCKSPQASICCICELEGIFLCQNCVLPHSSQRSGGLHISIPAEACGEHRAPGYLDRLQNRQRRLPRKREELLRGMQVAKLCFEEFTAATETLQAAVRRFADEKKEELRSLMQDLETNIKAALDEVERTMYLNEPVLTRPWAQWFRYSTNEEFTPKVFQFCIKTKEVIDSLKKVLVYDCGMEFQTPNGGLVPGIYGDRLRLYEKETGRKSEGLLPVTFSDGAVNCWLDSDSLFCTGGNPATANSYQIYASTYRVLRKAEMRVPRSFPGIVSVGAYIYVFGSYYPLRASCEVYNTFDDSWRACGYMCEARSCFTPCRHNSDLFLFSAYKTRKELEAFSLATENFRRVSLDLSDLDSYCIAYSTSSDLVIVTQRQAVKMNLRDFSDATIYQVRNKCVRLPAATSPCAYSTRIFIVDSARANCFVFDEDSMEWRSLSSP